ncbi:MAG: ABC transporter permease [Acetobacteraceae bacterium]|nr:ABC transporter permease [Acetobacteraceae bacterium]
MAERSAGMTVAERGSEVVLAFAGRLDAEGAALLWHEAMRSAATARDRALVFDLAGVSSSDMAGTAFLLAVQSRHGAEASVRGASAQMRALLDRALKAAPAPAKPPLPPPFTFKQMAAAGLEAATSGIAFLGEAAVATVRLPLRRRMLRTDDVLSYADQAGVRSMPLVVMLGFLIGVILAFQSAVPMRRFGADLYVANLVSISLLRELGPLLAAVILAGRTGSAFAAEIGTMKVNDEIDALVTMGLDPMTMLVLPRMIAVMIVMPAMTLILDIAGLIGMATVMVAFGFPFVTVANQVSYATQEGDLIQGLIKAICFGAVVAAIGCREGLRTGVGPRAVGLSATAAVVGGIVATVVLDGLFAVFLYRLNL